MSDMPNEFWSGWIAVITIVSLIALAYLLISVYFIDTGPQEAESTTWDENLREGSTPAPIWWFWFVLAILVFSVAYLMLYPGLGSFKGALNWSHGHQLEDRQHDFEQQFGERRAAIAVMNIEALQDDNAAMRSAVSIYERNCAVCHGYGAEGQAAMFPSLVDDDWQWGNSAAQLEQTIRHGRTAMMVSWQQALGDQGVDDMVDFVQQLSGGLPEGHAAQSNYMTYCVACHGADGKGNQALGAPNLTDAVWLYGDSDEAIHHTIALGRSGMMPAFDERLDDAQVRMLVAWLLGGTPRPVQIR